MRLLLSFQILEPQRLLPLSYKYELSAWLYRQIEKADGAFAHFLHEQGYMLGGKRFKLFTFSDLDARPYQIQGDRMQLYGNEISCVVSFFVDQAAESVVMGLFQHEVFSLGDRVSQVSLRIKHIEVLPLRIGSSTIRLRTSSPMVVSKNAEDGSPHPQYLSPKDSAFEQYFFQNLLNKYTTAMSHGLISQMDLSLQPTFRLLSKHPKSRLIRIKAFQPEETYVRGYLFDFELTAPKALIEFGMLSGFGVSNALGFGATRKLG